MQIRRLLTSDAAAQRALRLRALREHPEAFTSSDEAEARKTTASSQQRLEPTSPACYWGAFVDAALVGQLGLEGELRAKSRHKALVQGMYVAPPSTRARALPGPCCKPC